MTNPRIRRLRQASALLVQAVELFEGDTAAARKWPRG
jgi:hypothetical protein